MDVFERVREVNTSASLTDDRVAAARARLLSGIDESREQNRRRLALRTLLIAGTVAATAAVATAVVVFTQETAPPPRVEAIPTPTVTPQQPATPSPQPSPTSGTGATEPFPGTTPQAGQYLRIVGVTERLHYRASSGGAFPWAWMSESSSPPVSALLARDREEQYVPADRSGDWYQVHGPKAERVELFPGVQGPDEDQAWNTIMPEDSTVGETSSTGGLAGDAFPPVGSTEYYADLPREPRALLDHLRAVVGTWTSSPEETDDALLENMTSTLLSNFAPADVRKAYVGALTLSGLAQTSSSDDGTVSFELRREQYSPRTEKLIVDESTGWATVHTVRYDRQAGATGDMVPTDVPDIRTTYTVSIANSGP
ncbi:hypothetical protein ACFC14_16615 [Microbacterium sp. NPDC055988]|uniref:hypothetical protein n=1 Tax=Microbacterium sp. NPDC055988 TaxID=3345671 RepID=UPI0035DD9F4A